MTTWLNGHDIRMAHSQTRLALTTHWWRGAPGRRAAQRFQMLLRNPRSRPTLNRLWPLVNLQKNQFLPAKRPSGYRDYRVTTMGRRIRRKSTIPNRVQAATRNIARCKYPEMMVPAALSTNAGSVAGADSAGSP